MKNTVHTQAKRRIDKVSRPLNELGRSVKEVFLDKLNICLLITGVIYWVFRPFFEQLFSRYLVVPFLSCFQNGVLTQIVSWGVVALILVKCGIACRNRKRISGIRLFRWILITVIWAEIRFSEAWSFVPWAGCVTYFDIVFLYALSIVVEYGYQFIKCKPTEKIEEEGFECDEPIENSEEDMLGRSGFAQTLARRLLKTESGHQSFAIGIVSSWGYGKSSFLNLVKEELKLHRAICIDFSPWIYGKDKDLIREFFAEMGKQLCRYADTLPRDMMEYAQILEKSESTSWLSMLISFGSPEYSLERKSNLLRQSLEKIDRAIVVFIDDLDRMGCDEIIEVLKLIRNAANFSKIKFVVAYDRPYLVEAIKKQNIESANCYLEKIFQIEYTLPVFEREKLILYLKSRCNKFVREDEREELIKTIDSKKPYEGIAIEELVTLRDVKRYVNSLKISYKKLAGNVVLRDLMNLEILRLKYRPVYDLLSQRWEQVITYKEGTLKLYEPEEEKEKRKDILEYQNTPLSYIDPLLKAMGYSAIEIIQIIRVLKFLFPPFSFSADYGAINNVDSIERYFYNSLSDKDIPIETFDRLWEKEYSDIKTEVDKIFENNQAVSLVNQISYFKPKSAEICAKVTKVMFYVGTKSTQTGSLYSDVLKKIDLLSYQDSDVNVKSFLLDIIADNGISDYIAKFLFLEFSLLEKYFSFEEINNLETDYLKKAIQQDLPLQRINNYMYLATHRGSDDVENDRANTLFKEYVGKHIEEFLQSMVCSKFNNGCSYYVNPLAKKVWGSWDNFKAYVESISPRTPIINEFIGFLTKYQSIGAETAIQYKFKYII